MNFAQETANTLITKRPSRKKFDDLANFPLIPGKQAIYVMDWQKNEVTYQRNVFELLGYDEDEFDDSVIHTRLHPEDIQVVARVIKGVVNHYVHLDGTSKKTYLTITYRLLKRDGTAVKVLRQSGAYEAMPNGQLISNWSLLTEIGFISNNNQIEWDINGTEVNRQKFKEKVYLEFKNFFTSRELLVIHGIKNGLTTKEIAEQLFISPNTALTHRKNILRKCNCNNKEQLLIFCHRNGIL